MPGMNYDILFLQKIDNQIFVGATSGDTQDRVPASVRVE